MTDGSTTAVPWGGGAVAVGGAIYAVVAAGYGLGTVAAPGPGAVPFATGVALTLAGVSLALVQLRSTPDHDVTEPQHVADGEGEGELASRYGLLVTVLAAAGICAFVVWQSRIIGLLPASAVAAIALSWLMRSRIVTAVATGLGFYLVTYVLFERWLEVPLPHGYL